MLSAVLYKVLYTRVLLAYKYFSYHKSLVKKVYDFGGLNFAVAIFFLSKYLIFEI